MTAHETDPQGKSERRPPEGAIIPKQGWPAFLYRIRVLMGHPERVPALSKKEAAELDRQAEEERQRQAREAQEEQERQRREAYEAERHRIITTNPEGDRNIGIISGKGGVGKSFTTRNLAIAFAEARGENVVAIDFNPDQGNLHGPLEDKSSRNVTDLLNDRDQLRRQPDLKPYLGRTKQGTRAHFLAADTNPGSLGALTHEQCEQVIDILDTFYQIVLMDSGTDLSTAANQTIRTASDQLVIVTTPGLDVVQVVHLSLNQLEKLHPELIKDAVVAINMVTPENRALAEAARETFERRCRAVVLIPFDPQHNPTEERDDFSSEMREALLELAKEVALGFNRSHRTLKRELEQQGRSVTIVSEPPEAATG